MENFNELVGKNIAKYRKLNNLTQIELAEKINFSDKSISKWERGEGLPDIEVMKNLCEIFNITLNDIVSEQKSTPTIVKSKLDSISKKNRLAISLISFGFVWLVATVVFVALLLSNSKEHAWLAFLYAIPASLAVLLVFACVWGRRYMLFFLIAGVMWTVIISICISVNGAWALIFIGIPLQVIEILCFCIRAPNKFKFLTEITPEQEKSAKEKTEEPENESSSSQDQSTSLT